VTAQIPDTLVYLPAEQYRVPSYDPSPWRICGVDGGQLFAPSEHGLRVRMLHTACWRGYYCQYAVRDDRLLVMEVTCGLHTDDIANIQAGGGPRLFDKPLRGRVFRVSYEDVETGEKFFSHHVTRDEYQVTDLATPIDFTGGLLLARGETPELLAHYGYPAAYSFHEVLELVVEHGRVIDRVDHSAALEGYRARLETWANRPRRSWYARWLAPRLSDVRPAAPYGCRYE
jgi:hypothetical protein